jgi:hypothetical protein
MECRFPTSCGRADQERGYQLGFVHLEEDSGGERQSVGEAVEEGTRDFDDVVR